MMVGGYYTFQGINGAARYHRTPIEEILPVTMQAHDDRYEVPDASGPGMRTRFKRSWLMADETTSNRPAAVESAAARPPVGQKRATGHNRGAAVGHAPVRVRFEDAVGQYRAPTRTDSRPVADDPATGKSNGVDFSQTLARDRFRQSRLRDRRCR